MMCRTAIVAGLAILASAGSEPLSLDESESMSLLKVTALQDYRAAVEVFTDANSSQNSSQNSSLNWMGGFFECKQFGKGTKSGCQVLQSSDARPRVPERSLRHLGSASSCASFTRLAGADTFNFEENRLCEPLICNGVNTQPEDGGDENDENVVYSLFCGQKKLHSIADSKACGATEIGYELWNRPPPRACDNELQFKSVNQKNGRAWVPGVLPGTDLFVTASPPKEGDIFGVDKEGFFSINLDGDETTTFKFEFTEKDAEKPKQLNMFTASLVVPGDDSCKGNVVAARDYAGYYLHKDVQVDVKTDEDGASSTFRAIPDASSQQRTVSLYYRQTSSFELVVTSPGKGGLLRLGGGLMMRCDGTF